AVALYRQCDRPLDLGVSLVRLARALTSLGRFDRPAAALAEALPLLEADPVPRALAFYFAAAGYLKLMKEDAAGALSDYQTVSRLFREARDEVNVAETLTNVADIQWALG